MRMLISKLTNALLSPIIPGRFRVPFRYFMWFIRNDSERELRKLPKVVSAGSGVAIDVGANEGIYSYKLSKMFREVHAFEANPVLARDISAYGGNVKAYGIGLSDVMGRATLYTPIVKGVALAGWSSFSKENCREADELIATDVDIATLDSFGFSDVSFIKVDIEGHEVNFLRGALGTIRRDRPVVLLEVKGDNEAEVFSFFESLSYRKYRLEQLIDGVAGWKENYFFFPETKN